MNKAFIYKDKKGQQWFLGIYSNNFEDREHETFTWEGHKEYAQWMKKTGVKLPVTVLHQPKYPVEVHLAQFLGLNSGLFTPQEFSENYMKLYKPFAFAQTEAVIPLNGFTFVIAKILKNKERVAELLQQADWGMSHGFLAYDRDQDTIKHYRSFEFTTLPASMAANSVTVSSIQEITMDEMKNLSVEDQEILKQALEADPAAVEVATATAQEVLKKVLASKELPKEEAEEYEVLRNKIFGDLGVEQLSKSFNQIIEGLQALAQRMDGFEARMKAAERSDDDKVAGEFFKPNWAVWDEKAAEEPTLEELKEGALGDKPIKGLKEVENPSNPLYFGWMKPMFGNQQ